MGEWSMAPHILNLRICQLHIPATLTLRERWLHELQSSSGCGGEQENSCFCHGIDKKYWKELITTMFHQMLPSVQTG
jgi:hypothetical protein